MIKVLKMWLKSVFGEGTLEPWSRMKSLVKFFEKQVFSFLMYYQNNSSRL